MPVSGSGVGFGVMPGAAVTSLRLPVAYIPIRAADTCHPRQHGFPTGCLAGPGSGERQRGQRGPSEGPACGTLCALVFLMGASEPEHCGRVQIAVSGLPELPGNRTWEFVIWNANQGMDQHGGGHLPDGGLWPDMRSGHRALGAMESRDILSRQDVEMWGVRRRTGRVGTGVLVYVTVSGRFRHRDDRLLRHRRHAGVNTDPDFAGPAPG